MAIKQFFNLPGWLFALFNVIINEYFLFDLEMTVHLPASSNHVSGRGTENSDCTPCAPTALLERIVL